MNRVFKDIKAELDRAGAKYAPAFNSLNEALGTIRAEYRELEDAIVQHQGGARIREEAVQVAAMAVKLIEFLGRARCVECDKTRREIALEETLSEILAVFRDEDVTITEEMKARWLQTLNQTSSTTAS